MRVSQMAASKWMRKTKGSDPTIVANAQNTGTEMSMLLLGASPRPPAAAGSTKSINGALRHAQTKYQTLHAVRILCAPFIDVSCSNHRVKCGPGEPSASRRFP